MSHMMPPYYPTQPTETLDQMYPEIYYKCYPVVKRACEMYDVPSNPMFYPYPTRAAVQQLADYCCQQIESDPAFMMDRQGRLFRDLVLILLLRQLLFRRGVYWY